MSIASAPITPDTTPASGASDYIVKALRYYLENNAYENNERQQALAIKNISRKLTIHTIPKNICHTLESLSDI
jgi:hypothetical protein